MTTQNASSELYKLYETTTLDTPLFHMVVEPWCLPALYPIFAPLYKQGPLVLLPDAVPWSFESF
jgi:hypothetical protein